MRIRRLFFCLFLISSLNLQAQDEGFSKEVNTYLDSNGTLDQYRFAYDQLLTMLQNQYPKSEATANAWKYLEGNKEPAVAEIKKALVPIYQQNFERSEIKKMTTFYQSATGIQLTKDRSKMNEVQKEELNAFYNTDLGKRIIEKQPILAQAISAASENWSRDLYETATLLFKE